jgi:glutathione S-transferase
MAEPRLVALPYSPWSLKAKWALDHHGVRYRYTTYLPMLGEPLLRFWSGRWRGGASVPLLLTAGIPIEGSEWIARWADNQGGGEPLFPPAHDAEIRRWSELGERILEAGRALTIDKTLASPEALAESVPGPSALAPLLVPVGRLGAKFLARKYGAASDPVESRRVIREGLEALREGLGDGETLVGGAFSYADVAMACSLGMVSPPGPRIDHLGPASRPCWTEPELAAEFADLVEWRDRLFAHRLPR